MKLLRENNNWQILNWRLARNPPNFNISGYTLPVHVMTSNAILS